MGEAEYISSATGIEERADRIAQIIIALENRQLTMVGNSDILSYKLNDGQTVIETVYRSPENLQKAIDSYERILNRLISRLNGTRIVRLVDSKNVHHGF